METALHVAAGANQAEFVEILLKEERIDLTLQDINGNTAFCSAVAAGASKIVDKFLTLPTRDEFIMSRGGKNMTTLYIATSFGHGEIALKLYDHVRVKGTDLDLEAGERYGIFFNCIHNDIYGKFLKNLCSIFFLSSINQQFF